MAETNAVCTLIIVFQRRVGEGAIGIETDVYGFKSGSFRT